MQARRKFVTDFERALGVRRNAAAAQSSRLERDILAGVPLPAAGMEPRHNEQGGRRIPLRYGASRRAEWKGE